MSTTSDSFGFPFEPYPIQKDFMSSLYNALSQEKIGIFESPTGTVMKSLYILFQVFDQIPFLSGQIIKFDMWITEMASRSGS
jgi:hypothetical protein